MCQPFCAALLLHFLQVKISHLHLQLPGQQTQQVSQVLQQMHREARKQPTRKTHKLVNAGLTLFSGTLCFFYIMFLSVLLWLKQEAAYWWRWEDRIYRRGRVAHEVREYPPAGYGCEEFSGNDLGISASQIPWQPQFVLVK